MSANIELTRTIDAPRELVFKAFTEPEQLKSWWGPKGWPFQVIQFELRQDGVIRYSQTSPEGDVMWIKFVYREIQAPEKLVYSSFFTDEEGNVIHAPFHESWPLETMTSFTFVEHDGKTTLTMVSHPVSPTEEELKTFEESQEMMREGFGGTFDQLIDYLSKV